MDEVSKKETKISTKVNEKVAKQLIEEDLIVMIMTFLIYTLLLIGYCMA